MFSFVLLFLFPLVPYLSIQSSVAYWPPTRPGCQNRKCTCVNNRWIRSRNIITLTVDRLNSPGERERNAVMANRVGVNMLQFCSVFNSLSHTTFSIKWEVYFSKEPVSLGFYCVVVIIPHTYRCTYIWVYNKKSSWVFNEMEPLKWVDHFTYIGRLPHLLKAM